MRAVARCPAEACSNGMYSPSRERYSKVTESEGGATRTRIHESSSRRLASARKSLSAKPAA